MAIVIDIGTQADLGVFSKMVDALTNVQSSVKGVTNQARRGGGGGGFVQSVANSKPPPQVTATPLQQFKFFDAANKATGGQYKQQANQAARDGFNFYAQHFARTGDPKSLAAMNTLSNHLAKQNQGGGPMMNLLRSTRFNVGGVSPLVGRTMDAMEAMGPRFAAMAGPIGIATLAFTAVGMAALSAKDQLTSFTSGMLEAGTSIGTYSQMQRAGSLLGGDMAARAQKFQDAISRGGMAQFQAMQAGINPMGGAFGDRDAGAKLMTALKDVANSSSFEEARRKAMNYGQADMAKSFLLSDEAKKHMFSGANQPTMESMKQAEEFSFWLEEAKRSGMEFVRVVGTPFLRVMSKVTQFFVTLMEKISGFFQSTLGQVIIASLGGLAGVGYLFDGKKKPDTAMDRMTNALHENTRALKDTREVLGGGQRAQRALPSRVRGQYMNQRAYRQALQGGVL